MDQAVPKSAVAFLTGGFAPPPAATGADGWPPEIAAMSAKASAPLAAALGFFEGGGYGAAPSDYPAAATAAALTSAATDVANALAGLVGQIGYQKAGFASPPRWGPFDKGCKGGKGYGKAAPMFVAPPSLPSAAVPGATVRGGFKGGGKGAAAGGGPRVVLPPALTGQAATSDPGPQPEALPSETDAEAWLELLRDGFSQQRRCENDCREPPPFHRALHFAAPVGEKVPEGKYPGEGLNTQLQVLFQVRNALTPEAGETAPASAPVVVMPPMHALALGYGASLPHFDGFDHWE